MPQYYRKYIVCILNCAFGFFSVYALLVWPGWAQTAAYRIGPSDVLRLTIYAGGESQYDANLTVSARGTIIPPFIGPVMAAGLTTTELEKAIRGPLAQDYLVNPEVSITVKEYHSLHYYISGAVKKPGLYEMTKEASLLELIAKAEGVKPERGNVAYIMRKAYKKGEKVNPDQTLGKDPIKVDLKRLLDQGDMRANIMLQPADVVYIPFQQSLNLSTSKIYVDGEVENPGVYDFQPGMTAMNACIMAGGFDKFAAPNRTRIIRRKGNKDEIIRINLNLVQEGKIDDIALLPGDRIHVPESWL